MAKSMAIDFGGTAIKIGLVDDGRVAAFASLPAYSEQGLIPRLPDVERAVRDLSAGSEFTGVGIAMPGLVDAKAGRVLEMYEKYPDSFAFDLRGWCHDAFGVPMWLEQDSKAALLGEHVYGNAKGYRNVLMLMLGTGLGTAVLLDGRLLEGAHHFAGSLGSHIIIRMDGRRCTCGGQGCLEAYASGWALEQMLREHPRFGESGLKDEPSLDFEALGRWAEKGDITAADVLAQVAQALRTGVISLIHAYDPDTVVLSGGAFKMGRQLTGPAFDTIEEEIWGQGRCIRVVTAQNPETSVLLGLHYLCQRGE